MDKLKFITALSVIIITIMSIFLYFGVKGHIEHKKFYKTSIQHKVVKRDNWQLRATEFYLENGIKIDFFGLPKYMFDLKLNDSIVKFANSSFFRVYRKSGSNNKYDLIHYYKYRF